MTKPNIACIPINTLVLKDSLAVSEREKCVE